MLKKTDLRIIKTKKAMQALTGPETMEVLVDNEIAVQNVTKLAKEQGEKPPEQYSFEEYDDQWKKAIQALK